VNVSIRVGKGGGRAKHCPYLYKSVCNNSVLTRGVVPVYRKNDSIASTVSGSSNSSNPLTAASETDGGGEEGAAATPSSLNESVRSRISSASSACSTTPSLDVSLNSAGGVSAAARSDRTPGSAAGDGGQPAADPYRTPDFYIIRVSLESSTEATEGKFSV
jgi:hypothetical protein